MGYDRLARHFSRCDQPTVTTLPDGSVDYYCSVTGGTGDLLDTRDALADELLGDRTSIEYVVETTEPGGQAVNAAKQLHALGGDVTCYGHLDSPVFDATSFETVSMGDPALVYVFTFSDRDVMFVNNSGVTDWTLDDLRRERSLSAVFDSDVVCCSNWLSLSGLEDAFYQLAEEDLPRIPFVFDPGDIVGNSHDEIDALHDALAALQNTFDVVYNANRAEVRTTTAPFEETFEDDIDRLAAIRAETGITAAAMHARDEAAVVSSDERTSVDNYHVTKPARHTGGGDRFTGGLGYALACDWDWESGLACGNACATYYVETGETATVDDIVTLVEEHRPAER
ncbi:carbohydrate kinase family protein [Salinibaculum salinum]|uniref:carbohydrate kinase family protein n=1 Tax=Salinibaculum salinum TaxID=3131996 RepID=UPI0030EF7E6A